MSCAIYMFKLPPATALRTWFLCGRSDDAYDIHPCSRPFVHAALSCVFHPDYFPNELSGGELKRWGHYFYVVNNRRLYRFSLSAGRHNANDCNRGELRNAIVKRPASLVAPAVNTMRVSPENNLRYFPELVPHGCVDSPSDEKEHVRGGL